MPNILSGGSRWCCQAGTNKTHRTNNHRNESVFGAVVLHIGRVSDLVEMLNFRNPEFDRIVFDTFCPSSIVRNSAQ